TGTPLGVGRCRGNTLSVCEVFYATAVPVGVARRLPGCLAPPSPAGAFLPLNQTINCVNPITQLSHSCPPCLGVTRGAMPGWGPLRIRVKSDEIRQTSPTAGTPAGRG